LEKFGCPINTSRLSKIYKENNNYWAVRPMTEEMLQYASQDVCHLIALKDKILEKKSDNLSRIICDSESAVREFRDRSFHEVVPVPSHKVGRVIGKGGSNIALIENITGAKVSCKSVGGFLVLAHTADQIKIAKRMILSK
jgi:predicted PilT family ATPase